MSYLSIKLSPLNGESPSGYLLRLIKVNGFKTTDELMTRHQFNHIIRGVGKLHDKTVQRFELSEQVKKFKTQFLPDSSASCRICPECMLTNNVIKDIWQSNTEYHCHTHHMVLVEKCPYCQEALSWDIPVLNAKCTNPFCMASLPAKASAFSDKSELHFLDYYTVSEFAELIGQSEVSKLTRSERLEYGHKLLHSEEMLISILAPYIQQRRKYANYPMIFRYWHAYSCLMKLNLNCTFKDVLVQFIDNDSFTLRGDDGSNPLYEPLYVPDEHKRHYMEGIAIDDKSVAFLKQHTTKKRIFINKTGREHTSFHRLMSDLHRYSHDKQGFSLRNWQSIIRPYQIATIDVIKACSTGKLTFAFSSQDKLLDSIFITQEHMKNFVVNNLGRVKHLTAEEITKNIGLSVSQVLDNQMNCLTKTFRINNFSSRASPVRDVLKLAKQLDTQIPLEIP